MNTKEKGEVVLTQEAYNKLVEDSQFLNALISAGVDNWDGYEIAQEMVEEWNATE